VPPLPAADEMASSCAAHSSASARALAASFRARCATISFSWIRRSYRTFSGADSAAPFSPWTRRGRAYNAAAACQI
jgi:hypothetical protein